MTALRRGTPLVFVTDLNEAEHFYKTTLGFTVSHRRPEHLMVECNDIKLAVFKCATPGTTTTHATQPGTTITFQVDALTDTITKLKSQGVTFLHAAPTEGPLGMYVAFEGPSGVVHEIYELPS